jgi:serine/threonine protein kinase
MRKAYVVLLVLLALGFVVIIAFTVLLRRLQLAAQRNVLALRRLDRYLLVREIGSGGSGRVYKARHAMLRRPVAIKILKPENATEANLERFEHEVQATSKLTHPNTVAIYDYGRSPDGVFYYAMEYLAGISLDRLVTRFGPLSEGRTIHILRQICGSLAEAHAMGLIHRDIKPGNIILTRRGNLHDLVKVLDFGLVEAVHSPSRTDNTSNLSVPMGTPRYMAPEAILNPGKVEARSDLYSLGALGYFLVTGQSLFTADSIEEILRHQVHSEPVAPSLRIGRRVAPDLESLLMQCLQKDAAKRPPSAAALEAQLAACADSARWANEDAARWWQENMAALEAQEIAVEQEKTLVIAPRNGVTADP